MDLLKTITELSHQFGTGQYVKAGGGNSSVKDQNRLWVKPSGTTLAGITCRDFVEMDREKLKQARDIDPDLNAADREERVQQIMRSATVQADAKRPSVEAPLHNLLSSRYVIHTHPAIVNGMTCATDGPRLGRQLFPQALWIDYVDPGCTLYRHAREKIAAYSHTHKKEPQIIFLQNHGVFVAADQPGQIIDIYQHIFDVLQSHYARWKVRTELDIAQPPGQARIKTLCDHINQIYPQPVHVEPSGAFDPANGPVTPDHIVYAGSFGLAAEPTAQAMAKYKTAHGTWPRFIDTGDAVLTVGDSPEKARLVMELVRDGALIKKLARAFGQLKYMDERHRQFIENWEAEVYRTSQM